MNSIRKLFRTSSAPPDSVKSTKKSHNFVSKSNHSDNEMKGILKSSKEPESGSVNQPMWSSVPDIDDNDEEFSDEEIKASKQYAAKDKRRSSVVISKKVWNARRNSTVSNSSSGSDVSDSYSEVDEAKKKPSPREIFENRETRKMTSRGFNDFCVRKISQAPLGRREIEIAQQEMKGFTSLVASLAKEKPLQNATVIGCTHITSQTAVMIQALMNLGASVRWCSCNIYSTQNEVAAALAESGISIFAWKGQNENDFWWAIDQCIDPSKGPYHLVLDDGGDLIQRLFEKHVESFESCKGIVEESLTGIHRLYQIFKSHGFKCPAINISDAVTKSRFDNYYLCRETIIDAIKRSTDTVISGKIVLVIGYGAVGKGCAQAIRGMGAQVVISEVDPICALQACMEGYRVVLTDEALVYADIIVACSGTASVLTLHDFEAMKDGCIVCNMGHQTAEIDMESLRGPTVEWESIKDEVDHLLLKSGKRIVLIAQGLLANINCSAVPSIVTSVTSTAEILALIELYQAAAGRYKNDIYLLPKKSDELIARSHLTVFGAQLNELSDKQAKCIGVNRDGPFKPNYYRY